MQSTAEVEPKSNNTPYILLAVGCGVLFLVSLCCIPASGYYFYLSTEDEPLETQGGFDVPRDFEPTPVPQPPPTPVAPTDPNVPAFRTVRVQITESQGLAVPPVGSQCSFQVERRSRRDGTFWCHTVVACGGPSLFGDQRMGYFNCTIYEGAARHVVGQDNETTALSRDPAFHIDTLNDIFEVRDDASGSRGAFLVRGRVLGVE